MSRPGVRQALLKHDFADLYPGIQPGEWQPATLLAERVLALRRSRQRLTPLPLDRVLNRAHFGFRGVPSIGTQDQQRLRRLEDRRRRRSRDPVLEE
jgi:hypothetical protein